ncbi:unnamed protein product [Cyprideis torosa]|nr:unnamed protein product [Cyprideis torosa]CAG0896902.1 unnamed protein product [Cyprideis torosa]
MASYEIDVRSDTVCHPTKEMRDAMYFAPLGDAVFEDDPTVHELERKMAKLLGKEAGLFVPSGTMGNLICMLYHGSFRGAEVILGDKSHIFVYEQGGLSQLGGILAHPVRTRGDGTFDLEEVKAAFHPDGEDPCGHFTTTAAVAIENTHNKKGGLALPLKWIDELGELCASLGVPIHCDGARILNAALTHKEEPARLVKHCATVSVCLSKGVGAPVGSVIVGSKEFRAKAILLRKVLGGGMRQAGVLAAAGIVGLNTYPRMKRDHDNAKRVAEALSKVGCSKVKILTSQLMTNLLMIETLDELTSDYLVDRLAQVNPSEVQALGGDTIKIRAGTMSPKHLRLAFHVDIDDHRIVDRIIKKISYVLREVQNRKDPKEDEEPCEQHAPVILD